MPLATVSVMDGSGKDAKTALSCQIKNNNNANSR